MSLVDSPFSPIRYEHVYGRANDHVVVALLRGGADPVLRSRKHSLCSGGFYIRNTADRYLDAPREPLGEDTALAKVVSEAQGLWHQDRHRLFPKSFRRLVVAVLLLHQRLESLAAQHEIAASSRRLTRRQRRHGTVLAKRLAKETWLTAVVPFVPRLG